MIHRIWLFAMIRGMDDLSSLHSFYSDVVLYNLTNEDDSITLEGMHSNICLDMLVYYDQST